MTGTIDSTPCPKCKMAKSGSRTGLYIDINFVANQPGTFSLAGAQMKVTARQLPVLKCRNCDFSLIGEFDGVNQAVFEQESSFKCTCGTRVHCTHHCGGNCS